jgi:hypothetical protein
MDVSIFTAQVLSVAYIATGVAVLGKQVDFKKMLESFEKSQGLTLLAGASSLVIGMLLVQSHNMWVNDWRVLITIAGWGALIKGVTLLAFPKVIHSFKSFPIYKNSKVLAVLVLALGLIMGYFGFIA